MNEIEFYYSYLIQKRFYSDFILNENDDPVLNKYSQIAYIIRPMVYACVEAYNITGEKIYAETANDIAAWFFGNNDLDAKMYNYSTGICFDGINGELGINKNSGAESTIETLLSLQILEYNSIILRDFMNPVVEDNFRSNRE